MRTFRLMEMQKDGSYTIGDDVSEYVDSYYTDEVSGFIVNGLCGESNEAIIRKLETINEEVGDCIEEESEIVELLRKTFPECADKISLEMVPLYYPKENAKLNFHVPTNAMYNALDVDYVSVKQDRFGQDRSTYLNEECAHVVEVNRHQNLDDILTGNGMAYHLHQFFHGDLYTVVKIDGAKPSEDEKYLYVTLSDYQGSQEQAYLIDAGDRKKLLAGKNILN